MLSDSRVDHRWSRCVKLVTAVIRRIDPRVCAVTLGGRPAPVLLLVSCLASTAFGGTETYLSAADTHVRSANSGANFGNWSTNLVGREVNKSGVDPILSRALFHFDVATVPTGALIRHAALRLYIDNVIEDPSNPGALDVTAWPLTGGFVEGDGSTGVTWTTQPAAVNWPNHTRPMTALASQWFELDVTRLVRDGLVDGDPDDVWIIVGPTEVAPSEARHFFFRAKEHGAGGDGPQLVIDFETGIQSVTAVAGAEALVSSYEPESNFGSNLYSWILRTSPDTLRSLSHFDISGVPATATVVHAELRLAVGPVLVENPLQLRGVEARRLVGAFTESSVTWNNQPNAFASPTSLSNLGPAPNQMFEIDVTAIVEDARSSADPTNLWLRLAAFDEMDPTLSGFPFRSDEWSQQEPRVQIHYAFASPTAVPTATGTPAPTATQTPTPISSPTASSTPTATGGTPIVEEVSPPNDLTPTALEPSIPTTIYNSTAWIYTGPTPVQVGVAPGIIEARRASVIRGRVVDGSNQPISGVTISVSGKPELGSTSTRANGVFDLVANGGGSIVVDYSATGLIPTQRTLDVPWNEYVWAPEVVMIPYDPAVTTIDLGAGDPIFVADGSVVTDTDGTRQVRMLFPEDAAPMMVFDDGSTQPVSQPMQFRATEFTVGRNGPRAMPGELPPTSAYTYAADLSIVEADQLGAARVQFAEPAILYLENFIDLPVGSPVPVGFYDRGANAWIPEADGRIVQILGFDAQGRAELDTDGDNLVDNGSALGVTNDERAALDSVRYSVGQSLWRTSLEHFSPVDLNFPILPDDVDLPIDDVPEKLDDELDEDPDCQVGSIIECQSQVLGESLEIVGTPYSLDYRSDRVPGRAGRYKASIPLTGNSISTRLRSIDVSIGIAGRIFSSRIHSPGPNQSTLFEWNGLDSYGRRPQGVQTALIHIRYGYEAKYGSMDASNRSFGRFSGLAFSVSTGPSRDLFFLNRTTEVELGTWDANRAVGLGGWGVDVHHSLDTTRGTVYFGNGKMFARRDQVIETDAGTGGYGYSGDGGPAKLALLSEPSGLAAAPDGGYFVSDRASGTIRYVSSDGIITRYAGIPQEPPGEIVDPGASFAESKPPATSVYLGIPLGLGLGPDGSVYFADLSERKVQRITPDGILVTLAGATGGPACFNGSNVPAADAGVILSAPVSVAVTTDGTVYFGDRNCNLLYRVGLDGYITTVAGQVLGSGATGDGGPAANAQIGRPEGLAIGPDGSIYIADDLNHVVRRIGPDGIIHTIAGQAGISGYAGDGGLAESALLNGPEHLVVSRGGLSSSRTLRIMSYVGSRLQDPSRHSRVTTRWVVTAGMVVWRLQPRCIGPWDSR